MRSLPRAGVPSRPGCLGAAGASAGARTQDRGLAAILTAFPIGTEVFCLQIPLAKSISGRSKQYKYIHLFSSRWCMDPGDVWI